MFHVAERLITGPLAAGCCEQDAQHFIDVTDLCALSNVVMIPNALQSSNEMLSLSNVIAEDQRPTL